MLCNSGLITQHSEVGATVTLCGLPRPCALMHEVGRNCHGHFHRHRDTPYCIVLAAAGTIESHGKGEHLWLALPLANP